MLNVLILDDDQDLLDMVSLTLTTNNMKSSCINDSNMLTDSIVNNKPDIILMDIYLGESDGRELCRNLKTTTAFRDIPVILYSAGNISEASIRHSLANDFIPKPFDISQLIRTIRSHAAK